MKKCLVFLLLLLCKSAFSQLNEDFNDGNITRNPAWNGDLNSYSVNSAGGLQSNHSTINNTSWVATRNGLGFSVRWEFYVRMDFDPSSSNRVRVYLISDKDSLNGPLQGYFIQIGESGTADSYDLYRQSGTSVVKIIDGPPVARADADQLICRLQVTRDNNGTWELAADAEGRHDFKPYGTASDDTIGQTAWFGIACQFTATRSDKFYFDDFKIEELKSNAPPVYEAKENDIVINEIFADPDPSAGLPDAEFVELWNRTAADIPLRNWTYSDASTSFRFSTEIIKAGGHMILCARADTAKFEAFWPVMGVSPWPALNNGGDDLSLRDAKGKLISRVSYSDEWYRDGVKKHGGWSLELVDPESACTGIRNWRVSRDDKGGTPGTVNSVYRLYEDDEPLQLIRAAMIDSITLAVTFNRYTDSLTVTDPDNYMMNNGVGKPASVSFSSPDPLTVSLNLTEPLSGGIVYRLTVERVSDCRGTAIAAGKNTLEFLVPAAIKQGGILISEILFNPRSTGVDFLELYNNSDQAFDLSELSISNLPQPDTLNRARQITKQQRLIEPGEYIVLTSDPETVKNEYYSERPEAFIRMSSFPPFNNDSGIITLLKKEIIIDQLTYTEKMHMPLIKDHDGISLERSSFTKPANEPGNFRSAAASVGFATPGYQNSQQLPESDVADEFMLASNTFSPDNDGFEDSVQIFYRFSKPGYIANITVFSDRGTVIRKLYRNYTLASSGQLSWDGLDDNAAPGETGIYLVHAELFNANGEVKKFRKTIVLAKKLN